MPLHDWTLVDPPAFHDMHQSWMVLLRVALSRGFLPTGFYANVERHHGRYVADRAGVADPHDASANAASLSRGSTVAIRRVGTDRVVALIELASPSNKDRPASVAAYVEKAKAALDAGVHVVHLDMLPATTSAPANLSSAIWDAVDGRDYPFDPAKPFAADSFAAGRVAELYANPLGLGDEWPEVPLFLDEETYIELPLAATYARAFDSIAPHDQDTLGRSLPGTHSPQPVL